MAESIIVPTKLFKHGESGYVYHGCRCDFCVNTRRDAQTRRANLRRQRNPEKILAKKRAEYARKKEHYQQWQRDYYIRNRDSVLEKEERRRHTAQGKIARQKIARARYLRARDAQGIASPEAIAARIAFYGNQCYLCGGAAEQTDHVIPVARNGSNWPANIRPICKTCNHRKSKKLLTELPADMLGKYCLPRPLSTLP